jgi:hypothetical protein
VKLNTEGITPEVLVRESVHMPGTEVIEIPGLGYWSSVESAQEALKKLTRGQCPMSHEIEDELEPRRCRICGQLEQRVSSSDGVVDDETQ